MKMKTFWARGGARPLPLDPPLGLCTQISSILPRAFQTNLFLTCSQVKNPVVLCEILVVFSQFEMLT